MKSSVIIVAAGSGKRMNSKLAKQYIELKGREILSYTVETFNSSRFIDEIVLVVGESDIENAEKNIVQKYGFEKVRTVTAGGSERQYSVNNGLRSISPDCDIVLIHDGVRPFVSDRYIKRLIDTAAEYGACVLGVPVKDTIKVCGEDNIIASTPERSSLWIAQTPQCFRYDIIKNAYSEAMRKNISGTDDCMLVERTGVKIKMVEGDYNNIKITTPEDLYIGERILEMFR